MQNNKRGKNNLGLMLLLLIINPILILAFQNCSISPNSGVVGLKKTETTQFSSQSPTPFAHQIPNAE